MLQSKTVRKYDTYKDSGIEWIGEIPQEWSLVRAKHLFYQSFEKGGNDLTLLSATQNEGVIPKDRLEGVVQVKEDADLSVFKTVKIADFVISLRSFQGGFEHSNFNGVITPAYTVFRNKKPINHNYFKMLFKSDGFIAKINSLTTGIREGKNIQYDDFADMILPWLDIEEQQAIADYLDKKCGEIDKIVEAEKSVIEKLKEYKQSIITEAVTKGLDKSVPLKDSGIEWIGKIPQHWNRTKLKRLLSTPITDGPHETPELLDAGIPFLSAEAVKNNKLNFNLKRGYISLEEHIRFCKKCKPQLNDIFMIKSGATTGNVAIVETEEEFSIWSPLALIRVDKNILNYKYLFYYLQSYIFQKQVELFWSYGTQQNIGMEVLGNLYVAYSNDLQEQMKIAKYLDKKCFEIDTAIADKEQLIEKFTEYKKSLIYECVTGKRKVVA